MFRTSARHQRQHKIHKQNPLHQSRGKKYNESAQLRELRYSVAEIILTHFSAGLTRNLTTDPIRLLTQCLPPRTSLSEILASDNYDRLSKQAEIDLLVCCINRTFHEVETQECVDINPRERKVKSLVLNISERFQDRDIENLISDIFRHFGISGEMLTPHSNSNGHQYKDYGQFRTSKPNRRAPKSPNFPQHGGSLKKVIVPLIDKKAEGK